MIKKNKNDSIHNLLAPDTFEIPRAVSWEWTSPEARIKKAEDPSLMITQW